MLIILKYRSSFLNILLVQLYLVNSGGLICLSLFIVICLLELRRTPYDLVEGESELVSGYNVEYAGFRFTLLFLGEYMRFYWIFGLMGELYGCFYLVAFGFHTLLIAIRAVLPRYKYNQVLRFSWRFANLVIFFMYLV